MFGREFKGLYLSVVCRWLPAIALTVSLAVSLRAQIGIFSSDSAAGGSSGTSVSADLATARTLPARELEFSLEQTGDGLEASGRYQAARSAYAQIANPSATVWNKMGVSYQMLYNLKDAMRCYKESLKLRPAYPDVLNNLGTVEELLGDYSAAERDYRKALKNRPNNAQVLKNLGTNLLMQGEHDKSAAAYKQALAMNPHILDPYSGPRVEEAEGKLVGVASYMKAQSCARAGLIDCALSYLQRAFNEGSATVKRVRTDADFASLRGTPALARLLAQEQ
jgi:tetratricopeptide (TPR) repeat protein